MAENLFKTYPHLNTDGFVTFDLRKIIETGEATKEQIQHLAAIVLSQRLLREEASELSRRS